MQMRVLPLVAVVVAGWLVASVESRAKAPAGEVVWSGIMRQVDVSAEKSYPMTLTFKGSKAYSEYPELKCCGVWKRVGTAPGGYAIYAETITHGAEIKDGFGGCVNGIITVFTKGDTAVLGWFASVDGDPSLASAVLKRQSK